MAREFVSCRRGQMLLMPPSLGEWLPEDHLVWTVLGAVEVMNLDRFEEVYRLGAAGRPAYDPAMMVALLMYAYARGNWSSRGIERACVEDVAFKVICAMRTPDHSTIAEFRRRHETDIGALFDDVLGLCREAGLVSVGVITIDGTKIKANASMDQNRSYREIVTEILREAEETDRREDALYGDRRGDELPERLRTPERRRAALADAKRRIQERKGRAAGEDEQPGADIEVDPERSVTREGGRREWLREGAVNSSGTGSENGSRSSVTGTIDCLTPPAGLRRTFRLSSPPTGPTSAGGRSRATQRGVDSVDRASPLSRPSCQRGRSTSPTRTRG